MTAAPLASPPADPPEHPGLPAPFLALPHPLPPSTLRRNSAGIAVAVLLHGGLLAALTVAVSQFAPPVTPPRRASPSASQPPKHRHPNPSHSPSRNPGRRNPRRPNPSRSPPPRPAPPTNR